MGIFGFGSTKTPEESNVSSDFSSSEVSDDMYSPTGATSLDDFPSQSNTYEQLPEFLSGVNLDSSRLQPLAIQGGIDFLQVEDQFGGSSSNLGGASLTPSRGWSDDLCYGTGTVYLAGLTLGGAYGMAEGLKKSAQGPQNMKVRLNTTLNTITRRGPGLGNAVGVVAMIYNGTTALIDATRGTHDVFSSVAGGAIAGAIFKSTAGTRAMAISSGICATVAAGWSVLMSTWGEN